MYTKKQIRETRERFGRLSEAMMLAANEKEREAKKAKAEKKVSKKNI
jgi:hypothetical protein